VHATRSGTGAAPHEAITRSPRIGTLAGILSDVAEHVQITRSTLAAELFER
jgi:hypothetical protein